MLYHHLADEIDMSTLCCSINQKHTSIHAFKWIKSLRILTVLFYFLKQHSRKDWTTDCVILNTCIYFTRHITRTRYLSITPTCKKHAKLPLHCLTKPSITSSSHWWERNNLWFTMNVEESHIFTTTFHYWNWTFW